MTETVGALVTIVALAAAGLIALVFAATLAVVMVLASVLLFLAMLAVRARPRPQAARASSSRRAGHAWVSYSLERSPR